MNNYSRIVGSNVGLLSIVDRWIVWVLLPINSAIVGVSKIAFDSHASAQQNANATNTPNVPLNPHRNPAMAIRFWRLISLASPMMEPS